VIKCVIWDLDDTLLDGVYLEDPPPADPELTRVLTDLAERGIVHAIASKNPPEAAAYAERVTGHAFAAAQCGWDAKSAAITAILADLGLTADAVAFVDDDALERAEVSFSLPEILVLAPEEMADAAGWPQFSPAVLTDEARRRGAAYRARQARQEEARAFAGSRDEFLRWCQTTLTIAPASEPDVPRLHELSVRTHQFNSTGEEAAEATFAALIRSPGHRVITARLSDRFGDDGLVGCCVIVTRGDPGGRPPGPAPPPGWEVPQLMMSCRAMGRGVIDALLAWICRAARDAGADQVRVPCVINPRNVPLRIALTGAGFRAGPAGQEGKAVYVRHLDQPLPQLPAWVRQ
jgi:methoxymalonate biosynthesis protein